MKTTQKRKKRGVPDRQKRLPKGLRGGVELLLIHPVEGLGGQGDVVEVRPGYAHNYLIPQGLATVANSHHKRMVEKHRERLLEIENRRLATLRDLGGRLSKQSITIEANANGEGHLYGSVGSQEIVAALKANDVTVSTDQVQLDGPIKELGLYTVKIRLAREVRVELKVWVVPTVSEHEQEADEAPV